MTAALPPPRETPSSRRRRGPSGTATVMQGPATVPPAGDPAERRRKDRGIATATTPRPSASRTRAPSTGAAARVSRSLARKPQLHELQHLRDPDPAVRTLLVDVIGDLEAEPDVVVHAVVQE